MLEAELVRVLVEWEEESELVAAWELELDLAWELELASEAQGCRNRRCSGKRLLHHCHRSDQTLQQDSCRTKKRHPTCSNNNCLPNFGPRQLRRRLTAW